MKVCFYHQWFNSYPPLRLFRIAQNTKYCIAIATLREISIFCSLYYVIKCKFGYKLLNLWIKCLKRYLHNIQPSTKSTVRFKTKYLMKVYTSWKCSRCSVNSTSVKFLDFHCIYSIILLKCFYLPWREMN